MRNSFVLGTAHSVAFLPVNGTDEFIIVDQDVGFQTEDAPSAVCICGTCRNPMDYFYNRSGDNSIIVCGKCHLRIFLPKPVQDYADIIKHLPPDPNRVNICGRCLGNKEVQMSALPLSKKDFTSYEYVKCYRCDGSGVASPHP